VLPQRTATRTGPRPGRLAHRAHIVGGVTRRGAGSIPPRTILGNWWDLVVVIGFSLVIFYWAVNSAMPAARVKAAVEVDKDQIQPELV
jgi:hypothetical protein